jgi:hypothetical protein
VSLINFLASIKAPYVSPRRFWHCLASIQLRNVRDTKVVNVHPSFNLCPRSIDHGPHCIRSKVRYLDHAFPDLFFDCSPTAPFRPRPAEHFLEKGLNPASIPQPGRNYFPDEDPFPEYNYIKPELQAWAQEEEEVDDSYEHPEFGSSGNRMPTSMSNVFDEQAHTEEFFMEQGNMRRAAGQSSSCFMACYRPSLEAKDDNLDGVGGNDETNQAVDSNHEVIDSNHEATVSTEATDSNHGATEAASNDNLDEDEAVDELGANEATDGHQGTDGHGAHEVAESIQGDPEPMQHLISGELGHSLHGSDAPDEMGESGGWMEGFESVIMDGDVIIFFTNGVPTSVPPESAQPEGAQPESAQPEPTPPASTGHLERPHKIRRVHPRSECFPTPNYPANWPRLPSDPPSQTESEDNYDAKLSGVVFYDEDILYVISDSSNDALPDAAHPVHPEVNSELVPRGSDESGVGGMLNITLVNPELCCWFNSDTWTTPSPSLGLISISLLSGLSDSTLSSQEEQLGSVQTFDTLIAHQSHGSVDSKITPCPLTLFDVMAPPFEKFYTDDTLDIPPETEMDIVDLHRSARLNPSDMSAPASDSYPEQNLLHLAHPARPARPRRWVDRAVDFVAALTRSIGRLRFSRNKRPCSDSMV